MTMRAARRPRRWKLGIFTKMKGGRIARHECFARETCKRQAADKASRLGESFWKAKAARGGLGRSAGWRRVTLETRTIVGDTTVVKGAAPVPAPGDEFDHNRANPGPARGKMRIVNRWHGLRPTDRGAAAAIGNFDGVHLGHRAVIDAARAEAVRLGAPLGVVTFEPHPRAFFAPDAPPFRLMNAEARANRLARIGVARLYELPFGAALAALTAEEFARDVIAQGLGLAHVVVGRDFRFGKGRAGGADDLVALGARHDFGVTLVAEVAHDGARVSSTAIRTALSEGRPRDAAAMLGHWHRIEGPVVHGARRGRALGFPTANMAVAGLHLPRLGVYAVRAEVLTGPHAGNYDGAASLGVRPTFDEEVPNLETFLFDFDGDLYGAHLSVALVAFLRPEARFDGVPALIAQMHDDCARARDLLAHA